MNKVLTAALFGFLIMGGSQSAYASEDPTGQRFNGIGSEKDKYSCEREAMTNAAEKAYKACERFCNPQAVASFEIKKEEKNASCNRDGKTFKGSGSVEVKVCTCTNYMNVDARDIVDPLL